MRLTLVTPPAESPLSVGEAKAVCRIDGDDEDLVIQDLIDQAVGYLDGYGGVLGRCLITQTWRADITSLGDRIVLPFPGCTVTSVTYGDVPGAPVPWRWHESLAQPALIAAGGFGRPVSVTFTAGYGGPFDVPAALRRAIQVLVAYWYDNRTGGEPPGFAEMISPFRVRRVF